MSNDNVIIFEKIVFKVPEMRYKFSEEKFKDKKNIVIEVHNTKVKKRNNKK